MRFILLFFISSMLLACKSKDAIPADQMIHYVVIFEKGATPLALKKGFTFDLVKHEAIDAGLNQWKLDFKNGPKASKELRSSLLNHPKVISVMTLEQYLKMEQKNGKKTTDRAFGKGGAAKQ